MSSQLIPDLSVTYRRAKVSELRTHPENPNEGDVQEIATSIAAIGVYKPIVVQKSTGIICAGNHTYEAILSMGGTEVDIAEVDCDDETAFDILLADNHVARKANLDESKVASLLGRIRERRGSLSGTSYEQTDLEEMLARLRTQAKAKTRRDADPQNPADDGFGSIRVKPGDTWRLGEHLLYCGDCLGDLPPAFAQFDVLLTDPPYNVGFDYGCRVSDEKDAGDYIAWCRKWFEKFASGKPAIVTPGVKNFAFWAHLFEPNASLMWIKPNSNTFGSCTTFCCWDPILLWRMKKARTNDILNYPLRILSGPIGAHPCPKSLDVWLDLLEHYVEPSKVVFDPFCGSGTTILACENRGNKALATEIEPKWCEVAIRRWETATGATAQKVGRSKGPSSKIAA